MNRPHQSSTDAVRRFKATDLLRFGEELFTAVRLDSSRAKDVSEVLLEGDLLGHTTHGFALLSVYLKALEDNSMERSGEPAVVTDHGSALTWDGRYLPGPWLVRRAIDASINRLKDHPMVTLVIRRSHHIACLQAYLKRVTDAGYLILLTCSDPASNMIAPFGGQAPRYSPNPIAAGIPTHGEPILIDVSTSSTAFGLCRRVADSGEQLPGAWLMDGQGNPTTDPQVLFDGSGGTILPLGGTDLGYKGFAFGLLVEALTNAMGGHGRSDHESRWGASVYLQIMNPSAFGGRDAFLRETTHLANSCRNTPVPGNRPPVRLPGQAALARRADQLAHGVALHSTIMPAVAPWAKKLNVDIPTPL